MALGTVVDRELAAELRAIGLRALMESEARRHGVALSARARAFLDDVSALGVNSAVPTVLRTETTWVTTVEAAVRLGTNERRVRRMLARRDLVGRKVGGSWQVDADSLIDPGACPRVSAP